MFKKFAISSVLVVFLAGCSAGGRGGSNSGGSLNGPAGLITASVVIGAAILGHAFLGSKQAEVQKEAIAASTVSNAACNLGGTGNAGYTNTDGKAVSIGAASGYSSAQCAEIKQAQLQTVVYNGNNSTVRENPYAICAQIPSYAGRSNCQLDVERQIEQQMRQRAMDAARNRY